MNSPVVPLIILLVVALALAMGVIIWMRLPSAAPGKAKDVKKILPRSAGHEMTSALRAVRLRAGSGGFFSRPFRIQSDHTANRRRVLVLGGPDAGKKTLIQGTRLLDAAALRSGASGGKFAWTAAFGDGLALVPKGALIVGTPDKPADTDSYKRLLSAIRRDRPTRPIDSIVVVVPASELVRAPEVTPERHSEDRIEQAKQLRARLEEAQSALGVSAPVYLLVTKCDGVRSFGSFVHEATAGITTPKDLRQSLLGWSSPEVGEGGGAAASSEEILSSIDADLGDVQRRWLMRKAKSDPGEGLFDFPRALLELKDGLTDYLQTLLAPSAFTESALLRGVYLTGAAPAQAAAPTASPKILFARSVFTDKIFPEYGLCRVTARARRRQAIYWWALMGLAVLPFVVPMGAVLLSTEGRVRRAEDTGVFLERLHAQLTPQQATAGDGCEPAPGQTLRLAAEDPAASVLGALQKARLEPLTTWLLPRSKIPSFRGRDIDHRVEDAVFKGYRFAVLPGFKRWLECRGKRLTQKAPEPRAHDITRPFAEAPEVKELRDWKASFSQLDERNQDYDELVLKESIRDGAGGVYSVRARALLEGQERLAKYLFDIDVSPGDLEDLSYYLEAIARAKEGSESVPHRDDQVELSSGAQERDRASVAVLYQRMFQDNEVLAAVNEVVRHLTRVETGQGDTSDALRSLRDALVACDRALSAPGLAWVAARDFASITELSGIFYLVSSTGAPGQPVAEANIAEGQTRFDKLKSSLLHASTHTRGFILDRDEKGNLRLAMSPFLTALRKLLDQSFMTVEGNDVLPSTLETNRVVWNTDALAETAALVKEYDSFTASDTFAAFSAEVRAKIGEFARQGLEANLLAGVARAAEKESKGDPASPTALTDDVKNLANAAPSLRAILAALEKINATSSREKVRKIARGQSSRILKDARSALDSDSAYLPRGGSFAFWKGDGKPVYSAFAVKEGDDGALGDYADAQREHVATFQADIAAPVITFAESAEVGGDDGSVPGLGYFKATRKAFDEADAKKAGNAIDELHGLIGATFPRVTLPTCLEILDKAHSIQGKGFFQGRYNRLRGGLRQRCEDLMGDELPADYGKLRRQFDRIAAGRFPFASAFVREEAAPDAVRSLLVLAADVRARYRSSLADRGDADDVVAFLDSLEAVRGFLGPMWAKSERAEDGFLDAEATFRTQREQEIAGNRIGDWALAVGADRLVSGGERTVTRWHVGDAVKLELRWAKTSPDVPTSEQPPFFRVRNRTVFLEPPGQWALLRILAGYQARPGDLPGGAGAPHTLELEVHTESDPTAGWVDPAGPPFPGVRVFMKLSVWAGEKEKLLKYPSFPVAVPVLPAEKR